MNYLFYIKHDKKEKKVYAGSIKEAIGILINKLDTPPKELYLRRYNTKQ